VHLNADALTAIRSLKRTLQKASDPVFPREGSQGRFDTRSWLHKEYERYGSILKQDNLLPHDIKVVLSGRFLEETFWGDESLDALSRFGFSASQELLLQRWIKKEIDFVATTRRSRTSSSKRSTTKRPSQPA
jgi:hypothetical protein